MPQICHRFHLSQNWTMIDFVFVTILLIPSRYNQGSTHRSVLHQGTIVPTNYKNRNSNQNSRNRLLFWWGPIPNTPKPKNEKKNEKLNRLQKFIFISITAEADIVLFFGCQITHFYSSLLKPKKLKSNLGSCRTLNSTVASIAVYQDSGKFNNKFNNFSLF